MECLTGKNHAVFNSKLSSTKFFRMKCSTIYNYDFLHPPKMLKTDTSHNRIYTSHNRIYTSHKSSYIQQENSIEISKNRISNPIILHSELAQSHERSQEDIKIMPAAPYSRAREAYSQLQKERLSADCDAYLPDVLRGCKKVVDESSSFKVLDSVKDLFPSTCQSHAVKFVGGEGGSSFLIQ